MCAANARAPKKIVLWRESRERAGFSPRQRPHPEGECCRFGILWANPCVPRSFKHREISVSRTSPPSVQTSPASERPWLIPGVAACAVFLWITFHLDPAGDYPNSPAGPGLVVDEMFYISHGAAQIDQLLKGDLAGYRKVVDELPDHPPLGKLWLGFWNELGLLFDSPRGPHTSLVAACARMGGASAFAILIFLCGWLSSRWYGISAGAWTSLAIAALPRLFGHAHLAVIEMPIAVTYVAALCAVAALWGGEKPPTARLAVLAGAIFGLALLTKIQGVLLPFPVTAWAIYRWKQRAIVPILIWGLTGTAMLFLGWTWFWGDPLHRFPAYLMNQTGRGTILVTYFGEQFQDKDVPWHYPWVIFGTTIPVLLLAMGGWGGASLLQRGMKSEPRSWLLFGGMLFPLILFSLPKVGVYDGERLFLMSFPIWGIFAGVGFARLTSILELRWGGRKAFLVCGALMVGQFMGHFLMHPCYLSYYNLLVGGVAGAEKLGLQVTYWGEGLTRPVVQRAGELVPSGGILELGPVLHPAQIRGLLSQAPALHQKRIQVVPYEEKPAPNRRYLLMFPRTEYLPKSWPGHPPDARPVIEIRRQGVVMAGLYERGAVSGEPLVPDKSARNGGESPKDSLNR